jgi:FdrA protein
VLEPLLGAVATEPEAIEGDGHVVVDLGTERYTQGRPHPMVDLGIRLALLEAAAATGARRASCSTSSAATARMPTPPPSWRRPSRAWRGAPRCRARVRHRRRPAGRLAPGRDAARAGALVAPSNAAAARLAARAIA